MVISMIAFTSNDAITKYSSASMNMAQVMVVRGLFASLFICVLAWRSGAFARPAMILHPLVAVRAVCEAAATVSFLIALAHLPIANVSAVLQALPLAVTMGAAMFFGEGVGWRRWLAITVGFTGVLIIVRPGFEGFSVYSLPALLCVGFCTVRDLITSRLPPGIPTLLVSCTTCIAVTVTGVALLPLMGGWTPMDAGGTLLLMAAAILVLFGYHFIILSTRAGEMSFIAPFRYTSLLWSIVLGIVVFAEIPDMAMSVGAALIVASGLYTLYRERKVGKRRTAAESTGPGMAPDGI
jgi:drug/metabolite transporter (DMT)-like permease